MIAEIRICQSCGMPMKKTKEYGTNEDHSRNRKYCSYCYKRGEFTQPNISLEEMINKVASLMAEKMKLGENQSKKIAERIIPRLERWGDYRS